jgi:hypothetical protein
VAETKTDIGNTKTDRATQHKYHVSDGTGDGSIPGDDDAGDGGGFFKNISQKKRKRATVTAADVVIGITDAIRSLLPHLDESHSAFQAGKYNKGCFIEPHDDTAYKDIVVEEQVGGKATRVFCRDIAVIFYMTKVN